jgi:hypothetical protein
MEKNANFKSMDALEPIVKVVNDAETALNNKTMVLADSAIPEVLAGAAGATAGGALSLAALINLGKVGLSASGITSGLAAAGRLVGGGMVAGIGVLAVPIVLLGAGAVGITAAVKRKKLTEKKEELLKAAVSKYDAIVQALRTEVNMTKERAEYLHALNVMLQAAIRDLQSDLGKAA